MRTFGVVIPGQQDADAQSLEEGAVVFECHGQVCHDALEVRNWREPGRGDTAPFADIKDNVNLVLQELSTTSMRTGWCELGDRLGLPLSVGYVGVVGVPGERLPLVLGVEVEDVDREEVLAEEDVCERHDGEEERDAYDSSDDQSRWLRYISQRALRKMRFPTRPR